MEKWNGAACSCPCPTTGLQRIPWRRVDGGGGATLAVCGAGRRWRDVGTASVRAVAFRCGPQSVGQRGIRARGRSADCLNGFDPAAALAETGRAALLAMRSACTRFLSRALWVPAVELHPSDKRASYGQSTDTTPSVSRCGCHKCAAYVWPPCRLASGVAVKRLGGSPVRVVPLRRLCRLWLEPQWHAAAASVGAPHGHTSTHPPVRGAAAPACGICCAIARWLAASGAARLACHESLELRKRAVDVATAVGMDSTCPALTRLDVELDMYVGAGVALRFPAAPAALVADGSPSFSVVVPGAAPARGGAACATGGVLACGAAPPRATGPKPSSRARLLLGVGRTDNLQTALGLRQGWFFPERAPKSSVRRDRCISTRKKRDTA